MKVALILPFVLIAVSPLVGIWRANVWLKKNVKGKRAERAAGRLVETA
jgi:hypothetical protein